MDKRIATLEAIVSDMMDEAAHSDEKDAIAMRAWARRVDAAIALMRGQSEWISVKDRLPITEETFIGTFQVERVIVFGDRTVCELDFTAGSCPRYWSAFSDYGQIRPDLVTHWQPLPAPPKDPADEQ